jgi:hypothetical protein
MANDWIGLTNGALLNPVLYDESDNFHGPPTAPIFVWTGTDPFGHPVVGQTCVGWTAVGVTGVKGLGMVMTPDWTMALPPANCAGMAHLYCFEQ